MNEQDQEQQEFTLEEIMREFGSHSFDDPAEQSPEDAAVPPAVQPEEDPQTPDSHPADSDEPEDLSEAVTPDPEASDSGTDAADMPVPPEEPEPAAEPEEQPDPSEPVEEPEENTEATQVLPDLSEAEAPDLTGDTIRMEPVSPDLADTQPIDPDALHALQKEPAEASDSTAEALPHPEPEEETAAEAPSEDIPTETSGEDEPEPFSEGWEPEYDAPIGEYTPPQPIIFKPRSRLQELKQKLVAGPERRYYELMEQGLSKLQGAIFLSFLVLLLACGSLVLYGLGLVQPDRMRLLIFGQVLSMLLATVLGSYQLMGGLSSLLHGKVTPDTVLFFTLIACCADSLLCLKHLRVPYCAAYCLEVTLSLLAEYHRRNTEMGQMDTMRKAVCLHSVVKVDDYYDGRPGFLRSEGQVEDFMDHYNQNSAPEKALSRYMVLIMLGSAAVGGITALLHGYEVGLQVLTASLLAALPATCFITLSRPAAILERKLHRVGAVLCGWDGMKELSQSATVPLTDQDLFPAGTVKMNGMKFFSTRDPDQIIAYVTALVSAGGGGLMPLFQQILDSRNGRHYDVAEFQIYAEGGLGGVVNGEPVLVGTHTFLEDKGVEIPEGTRVNQALYAAVDGELCGVFAVIYQKCRASSAGLNSLTSYRNLTPILTCGDFMLTESFLHSKFNLNTSRIVFPPQNARQALTVQQPDADLPGLAMFTKPDLSSFAFSVTGARALRSASTLGTGLHIIAGCIGLAVVAILALLGSTELLTPDHLMLFELLWMIPGFLITEWTRTV